MITIRVISFHGQPPAQPLAFEFDETGGSIGRATSNQLVLPDPERHISRVQAAVLFRGGQYIVRDQGSANPMLINGRTMGTGVEAPLADGDELRIGEYVLKVSAGAPAMGLGLDMGNAPPAAGAFTPTGKPVDDPLALFGAGPAPADPFADLMGHSAAPSSPAAAPPAPGGFATVHPPAAPLAGGIPDDFDPFADEFAARPLSAEPPAVAKLPDDFDLGLTPRPSGPSDLDQMFGLAPGERAGTDLFGPGRALGEPVSGPNTAPTDDPFAAFGVAPSPPPSPVRDQVPELHGSYVPPVARPEATARPPAAEPQTELHGMVVSWDRDAGTVKTSIQTQAELPELPPLPPLTPAPAAGAAAAPAARPPESPRAPKAEHVPAAAPAPRAAPEAAPSPSPAEATAPAAPSTASEQELLRAFARGLGLASGLPMERLTPQVMELVGVLLRESVQGTLDLLLARAMTKREIRAEMTMIVGRENNPLKFSPNAQAALPHLLGPPVRGFMAPDAAMKDAYDDLRAHTFGFMAGMRAALAGVLARFDPNQLETRLTEKTVLDSLLPMNRRAKLWDLYAEMYRDISAEAEEDFHTLFGREFLRAYEEQVARLQSRDSRR